MESGRAGAAVGQSARSMRRPRPENRLGRVPAAWLITAVRSAKDPVAAFAPPTCCSDTAGACCGIDPAGACAPWCQR